uniref:transposase n=1 Tax=Candidatus Collinsella stercoripullorum TaxID=2838522 RepID=UPI0038CC00B6
MRELVRGTVEDTLNGLLEEGAGDLACAERYERTAEREACCAGHYERKLATTSGEVTIRMPKLKGCASPRRPSSATAGAKPQSRRR